MTYSIISPQQSLFDVAVEVYGDVQAVHWLLDDNPGLGITDRLQAGQVLQVRETSLYQQALKYLTDFTHYETIDEEDRPQGVGFWYLNEYIVQ